MAGEIAVAHHERWDGSGYPSGLAGPAIPLAARIVAIADVYDALSTPRVYKAAQPHAECVESIRAAAGRHFDPDLVWVWLGIAGRFAEIAQRHLAALDRASRRTGAAAALPATPNCDASIESRPSPALAETVSGSEV
jgi:HD-GYP domain-containing protein (c-di-GMP phosphodiesterase class II)